ncbi:MAG TPA: hypothetical protein VHK88_02280 [Aquihabitans sp.]|jgi:hypothetical protein|nr:hypothetical protein [Aquihabitans sp.]
MSTPTKDLFLVEDLEEVDRTTDLPNGELIAMHAVADWITTFVARPHEDLGRPGTVCPFVPMSLGDRTLWLSPVDIGEGSASQVVDVLEGHKRMLLETAPEGDEHAVIVVVFTGVTADRAQDLFGEALQQIAVPAYVDDGIVFGPFSEANRAGAIYNRDFQPFRSPVPFVFVRYGVVGDWKFFLDDPEWFGHWANHFGASGAQALAEELRRLPWNERR